MKIPFSLQLKKQTQHIILPKTTVLNHTIGTENKRPNDISQTAGNVTLSKNALEKAKKDQLSSQLKNLFTHKLPTAKQAGSAKKAAARMRVAQIKQQLKMYLDLNIASNPHAAKGMVATLRRLASELKAATAILLDNNEQQGNIKIPVFFSIDSTSSDTFSADLSSIDSENDATIASDAQAAAEAATASAEARNAATQISYELTEVTTDVDTNGETIDLDGEKQVDAKTAHVADPKSSDSTEENQIVVSGSPNESKESEKITFNNNPAEAKEDIKLIRETLSLLKQLASLVRMHLNNDKNLKKEGKKIQETVEAIEKMLESYPESNGGINTDIATISTP